MTKETRTLYEAVGGRRGLRRLSERFYDRVLADDVLAPVFVDFTPEHRDHVAVWLGEVFGGPDAFTGELGGHQGLLRAHLGLRITEEQRLRWMVLMSDTVDEVMPPDERLREQLMRYFDWGTRIARDISAEPPGADLGDPGPTPRWGWDGLVS